MRKSIMFFTSMTAFFWVLHSHAQRLEGFADMHTHPMSHLGFGGMVMFGAPDVEVLMLQRPDGRPFCARSDRRPATLQEALVQHHRQQHGSVNHDLGCGNIVRHEIIKEIEKELPEHPPEDDHGFRNFPHRAAVTHQQMWVDWIRRAHQGGLRVMVALAVNNTLLAKAVDARTMIHDKESVALQLTEMRRFVDRHSFMEIALNARQLRDIVARGNLAVVLGVETDDFGDLALRRARGEVITNATVRRELDELFNLGVRYILPLHFSNTPLGGYAIKDPLFALSSKQYTNAFANVQENCGDGIQFILERWSPNIIDANVLRAAGLGYIIDTQPNYPTPRRGCGHINALGLTPLGVSAMNEIMNRGMMLDIDHMSRRAIEGWVQPVSGRRTEGVFEIATARDYPLNSGHNGPIPGECGASTASNPQDCHENARTHQQYQTIRKLGGMTGIGHGGRASNFAAIYNGLVEQIGMPVGVGTDANGLEALPEPDPVARVRYGEDFPMYEFPRGRRWDYNREGFAHYGMFPDFVRSFKSHMTTRSMDAFMSSAEQFARMWEKTENRRRPPASGLARVETNWCTHPGAALHMADFNGDGAADLFCRDGSRLWFSYASDSRIGNPGRLSGETHFQLDTRWCTHAGTTFHLGDFNGDNRTDLLCKDQGRIWINYGTLDGRFFDRTSFFLDTHRPWCTEPGSKIGVADFNADGRDDLFCHGRGQFSILYATPDGRFQDALTTGTVVRRSQLNRVVASTWCTHAGAVLHVGDFNGDGRADLLCKDPGRIWVNLTDRNGHVSDRTSSQIDTRWCTHAGATLHLGDFNGDGRTDLMCSGGTSFWVRLAGADGSFTNRDNWADNDPRCPNGRVIVADINGDGRSDLVCRNGTTLAVHYANPTGVLPR